MNLQIIIGVALFTGLLQPLAAQPIPNKAIITGGASGRCTIEVDVDATAEVEISGDHGLLTTLSGPTASWRRFQCSEPLPRNPVDFRFIVTNARGSVRLRQDPRNTGGTAVIQINDSQGGRGVYTFDLWWRRLGGGGIGPGPIHPPIGNWPGEGGMPTGATTEACRDAVALRLNRNGYQRLKFERLFPGINPGRRDWITGVVSGKRDFEFTRFSFSCSVDLRSARVRSVDIHRD